MDTSSSEEGYSYSSSDYEDIELYPIQEIHTKNIFNACINYGNVLDSSLTGSGKTLCGLELFRRLRDYHEKSYQDRKKKGENVNREKAILFVVLPAMMKDRKNTLDGEATSPWQRECTKYGELSSYISVTYQALTPTSAKTNKTYVSYGGTRVDLGMIGDIEDTFEWSDKYDEMKQYQYSKKKENGEYYSPENGLVLANNVYDRKTGKHEVIMSPTMSWIDFCMKHMVLLVIDECHMGKNDTRQSMACAALVRGINRANQLKGKHKSGYVHSISATPMEKETHSINYMKIQGYHNPLSKDPSMGDMFVRFGTRDPYLCYLEAKRFNSEKALKIAQKYSITDSHGKKKKNKTSATNISKSMYRFWTKCILPEIHFAMPAPICRQVYNAFLSIKDEEDIKLIEKGVDALKRSQKGHDAENILSLMSDSLKYTEEGMVKTIVEHAKAQLRRDANCKVIIGFSLISSVDKAIESLTDGKNAYWGEYVRYAGYKHSDISSQKQEEDKYKGRNKFQTEKDCRVIIGIVKGMAFGIDLHDKIGNQQRFTYMLGSDNMTEEQQFAGRTARHGSKTWPVIFLCYPKMMGDSILRIYENNIKKSTVGRYILSTREKNKNVTDPTEIQYMTQNKFPGEFDRCIELNNGNMCYILDSQIYIPRMDKKGNIVGGSFFPDKDQFGYLYEDTKTGRKNYKNTDKLIEYIEKYVEAGYKLDEIPGVVFTNLIGPEEVPEPYRSDDEDVESISDFED